MDSNHNNSTHETAPPTADCKTLYTVDFKVMKELTTIKDLKEERSWGDAIKSDRANPIKFYMNFYGAAGFER